MPARPHTRASRTSKAVRPARKVPGVRARAQEEAASAGILAIDIGGTKVKMLASGETEPRKVASGARLTPAKILEHARTAAKDWRFDRVSIGYPGLVGPNGPSAEPGNLAPGWVGFDFAAAFNCPVRIINDAAMQALGSYDGGRMLFLGFGTGVGSALIAESIIITLELGDLPCEGSTASEMLGRRALEKMGKKEWKNKVLKWVPSVQKAFQVDYVVLGGGNAKNLGKVLPPGVRLGNNLTAFQGGFRLWDMAEPSYKSSTKWRLL